MKKHHSITIICLLVLASAASCINITIDKSYMKDGLYENYQPPPSAQLASTFSYSADQAAIQQAYGSPTRFTILFGESNRLETWHFDNRGYSVVFLNGTKTSEKYTMPQFREEMYATTYDPGQFYAGMGINEIVLAAGRRDFRLSTIEGETYEERLMHMEGLGIGLQDGRINYVETYPAVTERKLAASEFSPVEMLTPEETAAEGLHEYLVVIYEDSEFFDSYNAEIETAFAQGEVCLTESQETYCFERTAENEYISEDGFTDMYLILDGFIWYVDGEASEIEVLFSRADD